MTDDPFAGTRRDMNRAIRRLDVLEWVLLAVIAALALGGGWVIAWLLADFGLPFQASWVMSAILLFAVPGAVVLLRERRAQTLRNHDPSEPRMDDR